MGQFSSGFHLNCRPQHGKDNPCLRVHPCSPCCFRSFAFSSRGVLPVQKCGRRFWRQSERIVQLLGGRQSLNSDLCGQLCLCQGWGEVLLPKDSRHHTRGLMCCSSAVHHPNHKDRKDYYNCSHNYYVYYNPSNNYHNYNLSTKN